VTDSFSTGILADEALNLHRSNVGGRVQDRSMDEPPAHPAPLALVERDVAALLAAWADAMPAFGALAGDAQAELERMSDVGLVRAVDALARVRRDADGLLARAAAEVARRSGPDFGEIGLAKAQGFHDAVRLIAASTGSTRAEAARLVAVGRATAERATFAGERTPAPHPHVADALAAGSISLDAASAITSMLDRVAMRADPAMLDVAEGALARLATRVPLDLLLRGVREAEARLDADGVEPREEQLRDERFLTIREDRHGVVHLRARLDPESAAPLKAAVDALVGDALRRRGESGVGSGAVGGLAGADGAATGVVAGCDRLGSGARGPVVDDHRTIPQLRADALAAIARHVLGCEQTLIPLAKTTVIVRVDLATLVEGVGHANVDGFEQPVAAATARRLAADAELIPAVLGGESLPLDLGRSARLFTRAQRLALGERDGGCASCGQNVGYVEAHHIRWWERDAGPTDLSNGVLLCGFCHHSVHRDGWEIRADPGGVRFIPPPHIDPDRVPRLGGRARFEVSMADAAA
jgi:hypothetical protein